MTDDNGLLQMFRCPILCNRCIITLLTADVQVCLIVLIIYCRYWLQCSNMPRQKKKDLKEPAVEKLPLMGYQKVKNCRDKKKAEAKKAKKKESDKQRWLKKTGQEIKHVQIQINKSQDIIKKKQMDIKEEQDKLKKLRRKMRKLEKKMG